jgi:hypothetical protein
MKKGRIQPKDDLAVATLENIRIRSGLLQESQGDQGSPVVESFENVSSRLP